MNLQKGLENVLEVSVIVVSYNTIDLVDQCISSIIEMTINVNYEIIVVDNASSDGTDEMIRRKYKSVILIQNENNLGFGQANNIGSKIARGKYLFFLNSDTILQNNAIKIFYEKAEMLDKSIILGGYLKNDGNIVTSYGYFADLKRIVIRFIYLYFPFLVKIRLFLKPLNEIVIEKDVDFVTGADLFIRKSDFILLNGFDENIFMYCEDEDLCLRASKQGIRSHLITEPDIIHLEGASSKISKKKKKILKTSYLYFYKKNVKGGKL